MNTLFSNNSLSRRVISDASKDAAAATRAANQAQTEVEALREDVEKLYMVTEALFRLMQNHHGYTQEDLVAKVQEIDMEDGRLDGRRRSDNEVRPCPQCGRPMRTSRSQCYYCGATLEYDPLAR